MARIKKGSKVYIKELKEYATVIEMSSGKATKVITKSGDIIEVINLTIQLVSLLKRIWIDIKEFFGL